MSLFEKVKNIIVEKEEKVEADRPIDTPDTNNDEGGGGE